MANTNTLTNMAPVILAQGLLALRGMCVMPRLVNSDVSNEFASDRGVTIDVPIPSAIAIGDVTPSYVPPDDTGVTPTKVQVTLDKWKEAPFFLSDKDLRQAGKGVIPMQASEAIKALARQVNSDLFALYKDVPYYSSTLGTTPFVSTIGAATAARKVMNENLCPSTDRRGIVDADAEANMLALSAFNANPATDENQLIIEGIVGRKLGFDWYYDDQVPTHTKGTLTAGTQLQLNAEATAGATSVVLKDSGASLTGTLVVGDILLITGDTQPYVITSLTTAAANLITANIKSRADGAGFQSTSAASTNVTHMATHAANLSFHRDAFAFATRPLIPETTGGNIIQTAVDVVSGLALRLEISRQHKRTRWSYDMLYGCKTVRGELANRVGG